MIVLRRYLAPLFACAVLAAAGCSHGSRATSSETSASPSAAESLAAAASVTPEPLATPTQAASAAPTLVPGTTASPTPTATPTPNLLTWQSGTITRTYPAQATFDQGRFPAVGYTVPATVTGTQTFVFELPGQAQFTGFSAALPTYGTGGTPTSITFAVAADGANGSYQNVGSLSSNTQSDAAQTIATTVKGRWVRVTTSGPSFETLGATGTIAPLPPGITAAGLWVEGNQNPYVNGAYNATPTDASPWYRRMVSVDTGMSATRCFDGHPGDVYPGTFAGRTWSYMDGTTPSQGILNDEGTLLVAQTGSPMLPLQRVTNLDPKYCHAQLTGSGPHRVLVLDSSSVSGLWPVDGSLKGFTFSHITATMLDRAALAGAEAVIINALCTPADYLSAPQTDALLQWVHAGHKLLIVDADTCDKSAYPFLPYPFTTSNPGAKGASSNRLIVVESDALGATDKSDANFFDPAQFINNGSNQLGDANVVTTRDPHWCGHLFGTNVDNVNGFEQMYAPYGQGLIIYDGFDHDDANNLGYERVRTLELQLPLPVGMPCTVAVAGTFLVQPAQEGTFTGGKVQTLPFHMETLASLGWKGHVTITTVGPFKTAVAPSSFDLAGGTQPMKIGVSIPASAKAGVYTIDVVGNDGAGHTSQAPITLTLTVPLKKTIKKHERIRIYGIHFDVDSAHIQPQSEKVIKQIADLMKANPTVRFQVEGHTDSDGGAVYNLGLSQRRAASVVYDLATRYGIARSRMVPKGFGLTEPVKPNTTPQNKALNRRVELLAL
jgi:outer membrane protein OmpA-like peptidoglycan-associated protein